MIISLEMQGISLEKQLSILEEAKSLIRGTIFANKLSEKESRSQIIYFC